MRKSIFLTAIFTLLVSVSVFAQELTGTVTCPTPTSVDQTCLEADALHPIAGTEYTYEVNVPTPATGTKKYKWIVTQDVNFIQDGDLTSAIENNDGTGDYVLDAGTGYNDEASATNQLKITWKSFVHDSAKPVFVVINVTNENGCSTNNLKVYKIEPKNAFTLDIANVEATKDETTGVYTAGNVTSSNVSSCISKVAGAKYNPTEDKVEYDYGTDHLFFAVTAANFSTSWKPTFKLDGVATGEVAKVEYKRNNATDSWTEAVVDGTDPKQYNGEAVDADAANGTVGQSGECILVRVTVEHKKVETIADQDITLAVDGKTNLSADPADQLADIHHADCTDDGFTNDSVTHTLKARPDVKSKTKDADGTTDEPFVAPLP